MSATKEVEGRKMLEAFRGEPDGVELKANILSGVVGPNTTLDGDTITVVSGLGSASSVHDTDGSNAGDRYLFDYTIESIDGSAAIWAGVYGEVRTTPGRYVESITAESANTLLGVFARTNGTDFVIKLNSVQKLNPATMTAAALVTMGVGSDELGGFTRLINPGSPNFLYVQDDHFVAVSYDGTSYALIGGTEWDRGEQHLKLVQTNTDGSQFRVGNQRIDIDSEIQWSSWTTFDGSFDPTEYLRFALNNTVPLWLKGWALYKRSLSDTEIAKVLKEFQK
jgi:hypothetical protein